MSRPRSPTYLRNPWTTQAYLSVSNVRGFCLILGFIFKNCFQSLIFYDLFLKFFNSIAETITDPNSTSSTLTIKLRYRKRAPVYPGTLLPSNLLLKTYNCPLMIAPVAHTCPHSPQPSHWAESIVTCSSASMMAGHPSEFKHSLQLVQVSKLIW